MNISKKQNIVIKKDLQKKQIAGLIFIALVFPIILNAQTTVYNQLANEFQLARSVSDKFALELYLNGTFSGSPIENQVLKTNIQRGGQFYANYFYSSRWKYTAGLTYYYNKELPELEQVESTEWRPSFQAIYYINKVGFTLNARMRAEGRFFTKDQDKMDNSFRYRQMLKYMKPINSRVLRQGVFYGVASEELFFRTIAKNSGMQYFDRNIFTAGAGYMVTDDLQFELAYQHEFAPRNDGDVLNSILSITITFNNLVTNIKRRISNISPTPDEPE